MQDSYAKEMEQFGLQRGLKGSVASHEDIKNFYTQLNQAKSQELPAPRKGESLEEYYERSNDFYKNECVKQLGREKKLERKIVEAKTEAKRTSLDENLDLVTREKLVAKKEKKIRKLEEEHGSIDTAMQKAHSAELLNRSLNEYPDREYAKKAYKMISELTRWSKEKEKEKEI